MLGAWAVVLLLQLGWLAAPRANRGISESWFGSMEQKESTPYSEEILYCWAIRSGEGYPRDETSEGQYELGGEMGERLKEGVWSMT